MALIGDWVGGGAMLASNPSAVAGEADDPFATLSVTEDGIWIGWLGYRLGHRLEHLPPEGERPVARPAFVLACYEHVVRYSTVDGWWIESNGDVDDGVVDLWRERLAIVPADPEWSTGSFAPRPGRADHCGAVEECQLHIAAGDLYQANVCLRLEASFEGSPLGLWTHAGRRLAPARAAFVGDDRGAVASLSPEVFLTRSANEVVSRPIKGTRPQTDAGLADLLTAEKDRAEHVMIVDLVRNDLGRVSEPGSVRVPGLLEPELLAGVWHLVSTISASLADRYDNAAVLRACFPPGSVTGAPKVAAVSLCNRLEETAREAYCGAIGFSAPDDRLELSVAIRTFEIADGQIWLGVGGGIVADSDPVREWEECRAKAAPLLDALGSVWPDDPGRPQASIAGEVFDTVLVVDGRAIEADGHRRRFLVASGVDAGGWLADPGTGDGCFRMRLTQAGPSFTEVPRPAILDGGCAETELVPVVMKGGWSPLKVADRQVLDALELQHRPAAALLVDTDGSVLETTSANVFVVVDGRVATPPLDGRILPGVTRRAVLDLCIDLGIPIAIRPIHIDELTGAQAVFLTSSIRGITRVGRHVDPVVSRLAAALGARWSTDGYLH